MAPDSASMSVSCEYELEACERGENANGVACGIGRRAHAAIALPIDAHVARPEGRSISARIWLRGGVSLVEGITCQNARDFATVIDGTSQSPLPSRLAWRRPQRRAKAWPGKRATRPYSNWIQSTRCPGRCNARRKCRSRVRCCAGRQARPCIVRWKARERRPA